MPPFCNAPKHRIAISGRGHANQSRSLVPRFGAFDLGDAIPVILPTPLCAFTAGLTPTRHLQILVDQKAAVIDSLANNPIAWIGNPNLSGKCQPRTPPLAVRHLVMTRPETSEYPLGKTLTWFKAILVRRRVQHQQVYAAPWVFPCDHAQILASSSIQVRQRFLRRPAVSMQQSFRPVTFFGLCHAHQTGKTCRSEAPAPPSATGTYRRVHPRPATVSTETKRRGGPKSIARCDHTFLASAFDCSASLPIVVRLPEPFYAHPPARPCGVLA